MHGAAARAWNFFVKSKAYNFPELFKIFNYITLWKILEIFASDSPNHRDNNSAQDTLMKLALQSLAIALANKVLPQPGGP